MKFLFSIDDWLRLVTMTLLAWLVTMLLHPGPIVTGIAIGLGMLIDIQNILGEYASGDSIDVNLIE